MHPLPLAAAAGPTGVTGWLIAAMQDLGGPGAALVVAFESVCPPLPSEIILPAAGFAAGSGTMTLVGAILWTTLGSLVGALALYALGARLGRTRMRAVFARIPLVKISDIDRAEAWFARHSTAAVFFGRMIPMLRMFISLPAGVERMRLSTFVALTTLGSMIWNGVFVLGGYTLGQHWYLVEGYAGVFNRGIAILASLAVVSFIGVRLFRNRRARRRAEAVTPELEPVST